MQTPLPKLQLTIAGRTIQAALPTGRNRADRWSISDGKIEYEYESGKAAFLDGVLDLGDVHFDGEEWHEGGELQFRMLSGNLPAPSGIAFIVQDESGLTSRSHWLRSDDATRAVTCQLADAPRNIAFKLKLTGTGRLESISVVCNQRRPRVDQSVESASILEEAAVIFRGLDALSVQQVAQLELSSVAYEVGRLRRRVAVLNDAIVSTASAGSDGRHKTASSQRVLRHLRNTLASVERSARGSLDAFGTMQQEDGPLRLSAKASPKLQRDIELLSSVTQATVDQAVDIYVEHGIEAAFRFCIDNDGYQTGDRLLEGLGNRLLWQDPAAARLALSGSLLRRPSAQRATQIARRLFKSGSINLSNLYGQLGIADENSYNGEMRLAMALIANMPISVASVVQSARGSGIAYVAAATIDVQTSGYTVRTHEMLKALVANGVDVVCYSRPGYPWDRADIAVSQQIKNETLVDGVRYVHRFVEGVAKESEHFIHRMAEALVEEFDKRRPSVVHAASNNRNALPALLAAKRLGIPFAYEVRGLWELTAASKIEGWERTERFELDRRLEAFVATQADMVMTITRGVADELVGSGVNPMHISLLPNAVDPARFHPKIVDDALIKQLGLSPTRLVIAYAGSILQYEGIDDVINALGDLDAEGVKIDFLVIGDGPVRADLERLTRRRGLEASVRFLGRVPPAQVSEYLAAADIVTITRKPLRVCEVVSPLKPFEAMSMGKLVVMSDLQASREIVQEGVTGRLVTPASPSSIAKVLKELDEDRPQLRYIAAAGRAWVLKHRTWDKVAKHLAKRYSAMLAQGEKVVS